MTSMIGGYMWTAVEFEGVTVRTHDNQRIIVEPLLPSNPSVHVNAKIQRC